MIINPRISRKDEKNHQGETVISLDGKVLAFGKTPTIAFKKAQKIVPDLNDKEFLVFRILPPIFIG